MIRINDFKGKATLKAAAVVSALFLFAAVAAFGQQPINLTAAPTTATLPDGTTVPMWGYSCGTVLSSTATCSALNPNAVTTLASTTGPAVMSGWSPVIITVPTGQGLTINLTNSLSFTAGGTTNTIPTSIVIVGQVGGGLGQPPTTKPSPDHSNAQGCVSWFIADGTTPPGAQCSANQSGAYPPSQGPRVQSMATEVLAGTTTALTWTGLKPGTYLLESGTHPSIQVPMGLIGVLVVTTAPTGTGTSSATLGQAYTTPVVSYTAEVPLEFSEIDPVQNKEVDQAVRTAGFNETAVWSAMNYGIVVTLMNGGSGYATPPLVTFTGGTGTGGAAASTTLGFAVASATVSAGGTGYKVGDTIGFTDGGGTGAVATVSAISGGSTTGPVTAVTVSGGSGYTSAPTVDTTLTGAGSGAALTATLATTGSVVAVTLTTVGQYTTAPTVSIASPTTGTTATASVTLPISCGSAGVHNCYPPAVNYTPFYYLINGVAFNKANPVVSLFPATAGVTAGLPVMTGINSGTVLVRLVNAGLRMHVPSIVGSMTQGFNGAGGSLAVGGFTLIAEDGNPLPNLAAPRVQTDVFMAAGKTYDVMVNTPSSTAGGAGTLPVYDRELSLSANSSERDAGMLAYITVNDIAGAGLPPVAAFSTTVPCTGTTAITAVNAQACPDTYQSLVAGQPFTVSDPSKGVIANDFNVIGVTLLTGPSNGTLTCPAAVAGISNIGICANGTFTYTPNSGSTATSDSFTYCANGTVTGGTCSSGISTTVSLGASGLTGGTVTANNITYNAKMATFLKIASPGVLSVDSDSNNLPLQVVVSSVTPQQSGVTINMDPNGGFTATVPGAGTYTFTYQARDSVGTLSSAATPATVTLIFPPPSNLTVNVLDAQAYANCNGDSTCIAKLVPFPDYRWIIEEDKTFWVDPNCTTNSSIHTAGCPDIVGPAGQSTVPTFGVNFHTSTMDFVAQGCTGPLSCEGGQTVLDNNPTSSTFGQHVPAVCDVGNGACRKDPTGNGFTPVLPGEVALDPSKRYYISVLPGDAANPFPSNVSAPTCNGEAAAGDTTCGHSMSGAPIPPACNVLGGTNACPAAFTQAVNVLVLPTPLPTGKLSVIVFEDDFPLNGEQDGGGGNGTVAPIEPGLGGFNIVLWDTYGGLGDVTGQNTYDTFNQPLSNSLAGTVDPTTGFDACPISAQASADPTQAGITGMIVTCPKYESDGHTLSPLAGQAVIANLMPEKFSVQAYPGADRIARGEEWIQTNTLDGQHPHDSFIRIGEPSYFQEYGPAGFHVSIGFANPAIINARHDDVCAGAGTPGAVGPCSNTIDGQVDVQRLSRTPDQRLYPSGSRDALTWTQCWVSLGDPDGEDFMFTKCDANGNFRFTSVPGGNWRLTIGDQWNDQIIDGLSTPANVGCVPSPGASTCTGGLSALHMGNIGVQQWQANLYTRTFIDDNKNGVWDPGEIGIPLIYMMIHYRDGHNSNSLTTDFNGVANFNETFPLFNWYVVEADSTRYKTTGIHTVYDAGGPADGSPSCGTTSRPCGTSTAYNYLANTYEAVPLPADLSVPGAVYCATADCATTSATPNASTYAAGTAAASSASNHSTGRIDPPWVWAEGWSGMTSQGNWIEFGKAPYASCPPACATVMVTPPGGTTPTTTQAAENGGIYGQIQYASTRPFDDAAMMIQQPWEPYIPNVTVNLYREGFAADGVTPTLTMVDTTKSSSWDAWAQGFYPNYTDSTTHTPLPYMNCPGQGTNVSGTPNQDLFYFTLFDQPNYLDYYNSIHSGGTAPVTPLPYNSQFKCYDAMHIWNQIQPAPYDGRYSFPSSLGINPSTGALVSTVGSTNGVPASMAGTNCTICVKNPDSTDNYRVGTPMLPPGKYVVEVIMPPGYEVYKEEDKNLLIGDNLIAPVTQQFSGLGGAIFIIPDQASVASMYDPNAAGYNPTNFQNETTALNLQGTMLSGVPGFPGYTDPVWPCVGEMRVVPDYLSLFPQAKEVAPFAGATRPLCDRKEVALVNQMSVRVKFALFTSTHIASKYTGVITDDFTSEFDPFAPQFGEKFAPPNLPISTKDYLGNELSRVYSDHWGVYDGLTFSSWDVNPPNITGYSPSMMTQCMNDPGPILDTNPTSPTHGQMIQDPLYNPAYSDFCYEEPYMPGLTNYTDTPVVPTQAFVGAAYNSPDCSYPDTTPAIKEVDGDAIGPYVSAPLSTLTITALGVQQVTNSAYAGPSANTAPFNLKTITRHYGFGSQCTSPTAGSATCNTLSAVTIGGINAKVTGWSDTSITVTVPPDVPPCAVQQQTQYGGSSAQCGQLVIIAGNGKQSIDTVTVTVGGKAPTHVTASQSVQSAIDAALPGDLLMVDPGSHTEMLIMWKPVRLQGVGAATSIINANAFPVGKLLDPWRRHINCLFGLTLQGVPQGATFPGTTGAAVYDSTGTYSCPDNGWNLKTWSGVVNNPQIDRLPLEATVGWDATQNGNLAEQLQEPSLMGAFEGAGITVLGKGVNFHGQNPWSDGNEGGAFPTGTTLLTGVGAVPTALPTGDANPLCHVSTSNQTNPYPSNFTCNPASIDGLTITNSSQGGGGIFVHGWAHHLQIANDRVYNNAGTLTGGIGVGQGEFPTPYLVGSATNAAPGSCSTGAGLITNQHEPYCLQLQVNVHNNFVTNNSSLGDELFSGTLSGGGGVTFCTGNDYYSFNYNWVCGNLSSGEGGGLVHLGEIQNGDIEHNSIVLNQSQNPTIPTNGGGIHVQGTPDTDPVCGTQIDTDCPPGLSDGSGRGLIINANLIQGNMAESGSGGGIRLQQVNGTDVSTFPNPTVNCPFVSGASGPRTACRWNGVTITNNIIVNNVAGWDGAGISLQDSLNVSIINNTIASNDTLASSGVLTQSIGTPDASAPAGSCTNTAGTASCPQSAGVTSTQHTSLLTTTFTGLTITCPFGTSYPCTSFSNPLLENNLIWQNRSFFIGVGNLGQGALNQQNLVSLFNAFTGTAAPVQTAYGQCTTTGTTAASYWDIGVRGDTGPTNHTGGLLNPTYSIITSTTGYTGTGNSTTPPGFVRQYCNGSRVPPNCSVADGCAGPSGYGVPPGIVDASTPNPVFSLTPAATVDEGNNWINVSWGPLALSDDSLTGADGNYGGGSPFGNYAPAASFDGTAAAIPTTEPNYAALVPKTDFFGNLRPEPGDAAHFDPGAIEAGSTAPVATLSVTGGPLTFTAAFGTGGPYTSAPQTLTLHNTGTGAGTGIDPVFSSTVFSRPAGTAGGTCGATLNAGTTCTINVVFTPTALGSATGTLTIFANVPVTGSPVALSGTGVAPVIAATLTPATWAPVHAANCPGTGLLGMAACALDPAQVFTLTNTGNVPLTGIGNGVLGGINVADYARRTLLSTCGPAGGGQLVATTTLAPGATCVVTVVFQPQTSQVAGLKPATISVTDAAGTQTATLNGTSNLATAVTFSAPVPALNTGSTTAHTGTITVTNPAGNNGNLTLSANPIVTKVTGPASGAFSIAAGGTCVTGANIAPGATCTIIVSYNPGGSTTAASGNVTITGDVGAGTATSANFPAN